MKKAIISITGYLLFISLTACNIGVKYEDELVVGDSLSLSPEVIPMNPETEVDDLQDALPVVSETMDLESFQSLFSESFDHKFDFGWRYISANYDEYPEDESLAHTEYNQNFDVSQVKAVSVEGDDFPVNFEGFAHSYQYVNGYHVYVTYIQREISEEFHYYFVNDGLVVILEGALASAGGDEGSWSYSYGEFSKDYSVYQMHYADGEGLDTNDYSSDILYFE